MEKKYDRVPNLADKTKWFELEVKREPFYGNYGGIIVQIGERRWHHETTDGKPDSGIAMSVTLFEKEPCLISWNYPASNNKKTVGYIALRMKNGKWAVSNPLIGNVSIEKDSDILHYHIYDNEAWIFLKARKGWVIRKIKKSS